MPGSTLLHKLREHTGMISLLPRLGHMAKDTFPLCLTLPVGNHHTLIGIDIRLTDRIGLQRSLIQRMQIRHTMTGQLWECRNSLGERSTFTDDQFVIADI